MGIGPRGSLVEPVLLPARCGASGQGQGRLANRRLRQATARLTLRQRPYLLGMVASCALGVP